METIFTKFNQIAQKYPKNIALGYKFNGGFKAISYERLLGKVNQCVTGLKKLDVSAGDKVAIFSRNRPEWVTLDLALNKIGAISVPIHITLSPRLMKHIIENSGAHYLAIGDLFSKYQEIENQVNLNKVVSFNKIEWRPDLAYFGDLLREEPDTAPANDFSQLPKDVFTIIYTSGTTGDPKGVMLTNQNIIANIEAATTYVPYTSRDVFLSFLYLSHILERTGGTLAPLFHGAAVYFAESNKTIAEDIKKVHPTILLSVPRVFEKTYDKVMDKVRAGSVFKQQLFFRSLDVSRLYLNARIANSPLKPFLKISHYFFDRLVLKKVRQSLGGRLKFSISGGAPLNPSVARFFEAIGIKILEGYGLTETSPIIAVNPLNDYRFGTVGKIIPGVQVKIRSDKEILVKGHNVMAGYYNNEEATRQAFEVEGLPAEAKALAGWFKTGDLGYVSGDGYLTIIGRKKEMIVTSNGKNVNPNNLENALVENKYISQAMVYGDKQKHISALIVPDFEELKIYAAANNFKGEIYDLVKMPQVAELFKDEIARQLKDFPANEQVRDFILLEREFREEKEEITPTLKLRRDKILANFNDLIK